MDTNGRVHPNIHSKPQNLSRRIIAHAYVNFEEPSRASCSSVSTRIITMEEEFTSSKPKNIKLLGQKPHKYRKTPLL